MKVLRPLGDILLKIKLLLFSLHIILFQMLGLNYTRVLCLTSRWLKNTGVLKIITNFYYFCQSSAVTESLWWADVAVSTLDMWAAILGDLRLDWPVRAHRSTCPLRNLKHIKSFSD